METDYKRLVEAFSAVNIRITSEIDKMIEQWRKRRIEFDKQHQQEREANLEELAREMQIDDSWHSDQA